MNERREPPGVLVREAAFGVPRIQRVATAVTGVVLRTEQAPADGAARLVTDAADFRASFGGFADAEHLAPALVAAFFDNGGERLLVAGLRTRRIDGPALAAGLAALADSRDAALLCAPEAAAPDAGPRLAEAAAQGDALAILDPPAGASIAELEALARDLGGTAAALYAPRLRVRAPGGGERTAPPSLHLAGLFARVDREDGPARPPQNKALRSALGVTEGYDAQDVQRLRRAGVNAIVDHRGLRPASARALGGPGLSTVPALRTRNLVARSLQRGLGFARRMPSGEPTWSRIRDASAGFLRDLWRDGALMGPSPKGAFVVRCDAGTTDGPARAAGCARLVVGLALERSDHFVPLELLIPTDG